MCLYRCIGMEGWSVITVDMKPDSRSDVPDADPLILEDSGRELSRSRIL